jgi:hypothetical protein
MTAQEVMRLNNLLIKSGEEVGLGRIEHRELSRLIVKVDSEEEKDNGMTSEEVSDV